LDQAVIARTFEALRASPDDHASYSINLSGATITDQDTASFIEKLIIKYDIDPSRLYFEITETAAIAHIDSAIQFIERLTRMGCRFALDDFGSGTSSFSYLQQLPISVIKIDGAFVKDIDKNSINHIFVESIQRTAVAMNKKTVAEFVENAEIVDELKKIGIDYAQGYHIHKPEHWF
jgi:EAL domain-containing protein (putative c-di-GMP-specific phosphodiesterase class I)